jgi:O-acetyl-ADP-ribose deacetylase (regulator of RNase III)
VTRLWGARRGVLEHSELRLFRLAGSGLHVGVVSGDLRQVRGVDAWVNSENTMMRMARSEDFSVSSIIRYEGAVRDESGWIVEDTIADELSRKVAGRVPVAPTTAIVTGPGELRRHGVGCVVHVAAVHGEPGEGFRQVRDVGRCVTNALAELDRLPADAGIRSVVFPLLGVGQGGGDLEATAAALVKAAVGYLAATSGTRLETVLLLAFTAEELRCCRRVLGREPRLTAVPATRIKPAVDRPRPAESARPTSRRRIQVGFVLDVEGYSRRAGVAQELVQQRLAALVTAALTAIGLNLESLGHQWSGDGVIVFLPSDADPTRDVPTLVQELLNGLTADNRAHDDRVRLRMAVGVGVTAPGAAGFAGRMVIDISRLVESAPLREAMSRAADADLVVMLSDELHGHVVRPGYLPAEPRPVRVVQKEYHQRAWLWVP